MIMKFLSKISIFLLSAAIFMSALVVFADSQDNDAPVWPYLRFNITVSEQNRIKDSNEADFKKKITSAAMIPFLALARDYPDITMWAYNCQFTSEYKVITYGTSQKYELTEIDYLFNGYESYGDPKGMLEQLNEVVNGFTLSGDTMYDKLMSIHDFICKTNTYLSSATYCYSAYGALVDKKSVCEGYAEAFKLLCDKAGIDCILVTGMSLSDPDKEPETHMWNLVRMDDDVWYAVDVTWDDASDIEGNYSYFLVGADTVIRGKKFSESHVLSYDFYTIKGSDKTISSLEYPTLSDIAYDKENGRTEYVYGGERYHYNFLSDLEKEIYDKMLSELRQNMPSDPSKNPNYETTDNNVTTPAETTTETNQTTPEDTTTNEGTTTADTTTPEETTTPEITTDIPTETTTVTTETDPVNTTPSNTTEPPVSSTVKETEPPESSTTQKPDTTASITTASQDKTPQDRKMHDLYKAVTTVVIVCAISSLSIILGIVVIRYAKKHGK